MKTALEALERIKNDMEYVTRLDFVEPIVRGQVQEDLYKIYHREEKDLDLIEKSLKALEIIKAKNVSVLAVRFYKTFKEYNDNVLDFYIFDTDAAKQFFLTEEEYKLLKEVLK